MSSETQRDHHLVGHALVMLWILGIMAAACQGYAQESSLRAASGGVAGRLVVLPSKGSGLYSWALPVTLGSLLKQAQVETTSAEVLATLLKGNTVGGQGGGLPQEWGPDTIQTAADAGQVGKEQGYVLMASWNTSERDQEKWNDDTPFWLIAKLQRGTQVVFDTTRLPREAAKYYRLADYDTAVRDLADVVVQNTNPGAPERAKRGGLWRQHATLEQVRQLAESEQDIAAGRLEDARLKLIEAQAGRAGVQGSLLALQLLVEVNAALCRQNPERAADVGRQAEQAGRELEAQDAKTMAWAALSVAEGLRLQGKWQEAADAYVSWIQFLTDQSLIQPDECFPEVARQELDARKPHVWRRLTKPALEAQWWATVGLSLYRGVSDPLVAQSVCAHAEERAGADPDAESRADALTVLGDLARLRSDLDRALGWYQSAQALQERQAPGSLDCATTYNKIGILLCDKGENDRALEWYKKAAAIRERLAPGSVECAAVYNNMGSAYAGRDAPDQALEWFRKALAIRERLAPNSVGCASTYNNIGAAYRNKGDDDRALEQYNKALALYKKVAPDSRDCATIYNNLGNVYSDHNDLLRALQSYKQALAIRERVAPGSIDCAMIYNNMGSAYANWGDYNRSLEWHRKALPICERLATGSSLCALSYGNIGQVYGHQGDFAAAVAWLQKALAVYGKAAPSSLDWASTAAAIGFYLLDVDKSEEALPYLTRAAEVAPKDAGVEVSLAWGRIVLHQLDLALPLINEACAQKPDKLAGLVTGKDEVLAKHLLAHDDPTGFYLLGRTWQAADSPELAAKAYGLFLDYCKAEHPWRADAAARRKLLPADK